MTKDMVRVELDHDQFMQDSKGIARGQEMEQNKREQQELDTQEQLRKDNDKLGQSYKTIKNEMDSKKLKQGPWRSTFCKKLEKLLKEII